MCLVIRLGLNHVDIFILFPLQGWTRGVRYDHFWSWTIKMSPRSAFEEISLYRATAHIPDSKHCQPTSGPHGFHTGQMWAGSGPKLCCCLGFYLLQFWRRPPYQYTVQRHVHLHQCEISSYSHRTLNLFAITKVLYLPVNHFIHALGWHAFFWAPCHVSPKHAN